MGLSDRVEASDMGARTRGRLRNAIDVLAHADYELGCAARLLSQTAFDAYENEADELMKRCISLRERIQAELG